MKQVNCFSGTLAQVARQVAELIDSNSIEEFLLSSHKVAVGYGQESVHSIWNGGGWDKYELNLVRILPEKYHLTVWNRAIQ